MKKIKLFTLLLTAIVIAGTGCLKDNHFEDNEYGINDPDDSPVGVGFNLGVKFFNSTGLTLSSDPQNLDTAVVLISLLSGIPPTADVHVTIAIDPTILAEYNAANGTSIIELDPTLYQLASQTITIPAGKLNAYVNINVDSTSTLDPNETYGLGLRIVGADAGYTVAGNEDQILLSIAIRNIYDGEYHSNGYVYHPTAPRAIVDRPKLLSTLNATTVVAELGDLGAANYFAAFDVNPVVNPQGVHDVTITEAPGAAGAPYTMHTAGLPTTNPGYTPQWPRAAECNNTYDPNTQEFKVRYGYVGGTGWRVTEEIIKKDQ